MTAGHHVAVRGATWHISGILLSATFAASRTPATASAKPYAAAHGSITPIRIASGSFAASTYLGATWDLCHLDTCE